MTVRTVTVGTDVLADARRAAGELRADFRRRGTLVVNILASPGAGKTSLLEATARHWGGARRIAVLVGDIATDRDAFLPDNLHPTAASQPKLLAHVWTALGPMLAK